MIDNAKLISMVNDAIETGEPFESKIGGEPITYRRAAPEKIEAIMAKLLADYPPLGEGDQTTVDRIFNESGWLKDFSGETLDSLSQSVIPVLVMRHILAIKRCTFNPAQTPSWDAFSDRYQDAILAA